MENLNKNIKELLRLGLDPNDLDLLQEYLRRQNHEYHKYTPLERQQEFHSSQKYIKLLFGGNQSGKSKANAHEVAWRLTGNHPYRTLPERPRMIWVVSTEYQTIRAGIYRHLLTILPSWEIAGFGPRVQGHDLHSYIKMKNGSTVYFLSSKGGEDARTKFQAEAVDYVAIDEEIEEYIWDELQARLLATGGDFGISATLVESYEWIVILEKRALSNDPDVFLVRLDTSENPHLNEAQVKRLESSWDDVTKEYRLRGKSRRAKGLVYPNLDHWIPRFPVPRSWTHYHGLDPGYRVTAGLWAAVTPHEQIILYRELYQQYSDLDNAANEIKSAENGQIIRTRVIDDKEGSHLITGQPGVLTTLAQQHQLYYIPAIKAVLSGIELCRVMLRRFETDEYYEYPLDDGGTIKLNKGQKLFIFEDLEYFKAEAIQYRINPDRSKRDKSETLDKPIKKKDHLMDVWRYLASAHISYYDPSLIKDEEKSWHGGTMTLAEAHERMLEKKEGDVVDEFFGIC